MATACGSASSAGRSTSAGAIASACQAISASLSDGPDPGADPVGYAESQIRPLRQIRTPDAALQRAVDSLSSAYARLYRSGDTSAAKAGVSSATRSVERICPGVGQ